MARMSTSEFFDSYASDFNEIYGNRNTFLNNLINKFFRKSMKLRYTKTIEGCHPVEGKSVIDIGCGPGHYGIALAKKGARRVFGLDFAKGMIDLARQNAKHFGIEDLCDFVLDDFMTYSFKDQFDYSIVMGFMDYVEEPAPVVERVLSLTRSRAFFSFPVNHGILAWQRRIRYRKRCPLFMYTVEQLNKLFAGMNCRKVETERIGRDFFVTVHMQ